MIDLIASTPMVRALVLMGVFALVVLVAMGLLNQFDRRLAVRGELQKISGGGEGGGSTETLHKRDETMWNRLVDRIESAGLSLSDTKADVLRDRLREAGFDSPVAPRLYTLIRLVLVVALPAAWVLASLAAGRELTFMRLYVTGTIAALIGLYIPSLYIRIRASDRRTQITNGFPDCLDLMLIAVEAGLGLESALDRVAREMVTSHPLVSKLLATATLRLRAGATREEALRQMAVESGVEEIRSFATLLIQSDRLGTSIGTTLRIYASEMRERRRMRAEEKAHRLPVLLSIPLVVCMLPTMIGVLMIPAIIRIVRGIFPGMVGG